MTLELRLELDGFIIRGWCWRSDRYQWEEIAGHFRAAADDNGWGVAFTRSNPTNESFPIQEFLRLDDLGSAVEIAAILNRHRENEQITSPNTKS